MKTSSIRNSFFPLIIILVSILLPVTLSAQTNTKEQLVISLSRPDKPFKLDLGIQNGTIKILAYDGKVIVIEAEPVAEKAGKTVPNQNRSTNSNINVNTNINTNINLPANKNMNTDTNITKSTNVHEGKTDKQNIVGGKYLLGNENNNTVTLSPVTDNKILNIIIKIPKNNVRLNLSTASTGDITITGISGELEITANKGSVELENISGSAIVNTVAGNITATFKNVYAKSMAFSTLQGNLDISFPASFKANVRLKSDNGEIYTDFNIESDEKRKGGQPHPLPNPKAAANTKYFMNNKDWVYGVINRGGSDLMIKNMDGNIFIRTVK